MALVLKNGAVFLHIPKTGGNWITEVLEKCGLVRSNVPPKHADLDRLFWPIRPTRYGTLKFLLKKLWVGRTLRRKPFIFCFVRHPLSWYESWFKYMTQPSRQWQNWGDPTDPDNWHPNSVLNGLGDPDFNQFVRNVIRKRPGYVTEMYGWYTKSMMDFVGRQENLPDDLIAVLKRMNLEFDEAFIRNYPRVGESPLPATKIVWDDSLKEEVYKLEYAGIVRYGYLPGSQGKG